MKITNKFLELLERYETPFIGMDLNIVRENYNNLKENFGEGKIYYAVKANPNREILKLLLDLGAYFDIASKGELDLIFSLNVHPDKISYGNTIKKSKDIAYAYSKGVKLFVADECQEVEKISKYAPGSKLFVRLEPHESDSDWPLTRKFGTTKENAKILLRKGKELGLLPFGISFHVGSQCYDKLAWRANILESKEVFDELKKEGIKLSFLNTGGGMPVRHVRHIPSVSEICEEINNVVSESFTNNKDIILAAEPGRSLVGNGGILASEVILKSNKHGKDWVYIDAGRFHGLFETIEGFKYEVKVLGKDKKIKKGKLKNIALAGPTCDSVDTIYDNILLPENIEIGDTILFINSGAYTSAYSTCFNGIQPPEIYFI